ncbi:unnamed protein product [Protopolystoma xenopodis]|uniref:Uncharacterized protein n=1 Tax=Protopolystoma xenopodis TaxID=117903 RepID=A0A3S5A2U3_9PLAT|nr:unnamed protein product [Protopolystoma xenopodis]
MSEDSNVSDISIRDEELRFFEYCERYIKTVEENASSLVEYKSFLNSPEVIEIRDKVRSEIGDHELSVEDIVTIYQSCGYEIAAQAALADSTSSLNSPWCQLLPHSSLYTLEYLSDIKVSTSTVWCSGILFFIAYFYFIYLIVSISWTSTIPSYRFCSMLTF